MIWKFTVTDSVADDPQQVIADLKRRLDESTSQQTATADVLKVISRSTFDLQTILETLIKSAVELCGANRGSIFLREGDVFPLKAASSTTPEFLQYWAANPPRAGRGSATSRVIGSGKVEVIPDVLEDPDVEMPASSLIRIRATLGVPMLRNAKVEGVLVLTRPEPGPFSKSQIDLVQTFADQAMIAIENARLFDEVQAKTADLSESLQQQTATADVLKVISRSAFDLDSVLATLVASAAKLCEAEKGVIFLREDDNYRLVSNHGFSPEFEAFAKANPFPVDGGSTTARAAESGETVQVVDVLEDQTRSALAREYQRLGGYRTNLGVALRREGETIGVFTLTRQEVRAFTPRQIELVETFADQAVIAIENVRLFDEVQAKTTDLQESLRHQTATSEVLKVISRSPGELNPVFQTILSSATSICDAQFGLLVLYEDGGFRCASMFNLPPAFAETFLRNPVIYPPPIDPLGRLIATEQLVHVVDVKQEPAYLTGFPPIVELVELGGARTLLLVPMLKEDNLVGVIAIFRQTVHAFSGKQIDLVTSFGSQAVIAIENARLLNETKEALERQTATADILKVIASSPSDVQPVFEAIAERSKRLVDALSTTVFRLEDGVMHLKAFTATNPEADATLQAMFPAPLSNFSWGEPIDNGEIYRVVDTELEIESMRELGRLRGYRSMLFVPLLRDRKPIGVIAVTRAEPGPFIEHHVQLLQTFADQAVIAIENVRLFDEVRARTDDLRESLQQQTATADVLKVISRSVFDLQTVLDTLVESAYKLCGANLGLLYLRGEQAFECKAIAGAGVTEAGLLFKGRPIRPGRGTAAERVILTGEVQSITDFYADPEMDPKVREAIRNASGSDSSIGQIRSTLAVPMTRDNVVIGVMVIGCAQTGSFPQRQIELLQTFADQAVIAIENVRLFDEVQARTRELSLSLDELRTAQDRLVQTEKLASLGQLTAGIAHEIKNPLNFVNNFSALSGELIDELNDLLGSAALDGKLREEIDDLANMLKGNLEKVVQHGKRADSIVKNMLLHSREGSGERRHADINTIVEESLNLAYHGARAEKSGFNITLQRELDPSAGIIDLYPQEITRVFLNLISNGFYAANKRKESADEGFEPLLTASTKNLGSNVEIRIRDNGIGIPAEVKEKMFNPFFTTKPAGEGTGLGLSMSHDIIVKQHGGKIDVETEPGAFTEFIITLPRAAAQIQAGGRN
jgi:GAF domain-containing protein/anti-sigma regulatory factor (Ser/Thr protein kinase)